MIFSFESKNYMYEGTYTCFPLFVLMVSNLSIEKVVKFHKDIEFLLTIPIILF